MDILVSMATASPIRSIDALRTLLFGSSVLLAVIGSSVNADDAKPADGKLTFETDVLPIFEAHCVSCHSGKQPKAGLDLANHRGVLVGGKSGAAIRKAAAESSLLWSKVAGGEMPPKGTKLTAKLTAKEKGTIRVWINNGAIGKDAATSPGPIIGGDFSISDDDRKFWSFTTPQKSDPPSVTGQPRVRNQIDRFVLAKLEAAALGLSEEADRRTLARRISFDLLGLPPTPDVVAAFVNDESPDAYERLIENMLADPAYGERWGRHWLDVAGYADSAGILNEDRELPLAFRYRDYVIRALNKNKPYDRFVCEQLAGDELVDYAAHYETDAALSDEIVEAITATGYLRCAPDPSRPDFNTIKTAASEYYYPTINDTMQIVSTSLMGMTLQCARCHDHMFDPIPQSDFYQIQAVFMGAYRPTNWIPQMNRRLTNFSKSQVEFAKTRNQEVDQNSNQFKTQLTQLLSDFRTRRLNDQLAKLPESERDPIREALTTPADKRNEIQQGLAKTHAALSPDDNQLNDLLLREYPGYESAKSKLEAQIVAESKRRIEFNEIRALYDLPGEVATPFLRRGDPLTPAHDVGPGALTILAESAAFKWEKPAPESRTSGRRLAFSNWLTDPNHPLTSRVMVNRIWQHHFGEGIVATPDDFGRAGALPTHPEMLDWLAVEFVESGWDIKHMHRLIMTSSTYRQRSTLDEVQHKSAHKLDPQNKLLWRQTLRRLEAESIRDAMLHVSGTIRGAMFDPASGLQVMPDGEISVAENSNPNRRSIYLQNLRLKPVTMLNAFDQPVMQINCHVRSRSTVSTQALTLLNSKFTTDAAAAFAERILKVAADDSGIAERAIDMAFGRPASIEESITLGSFLESQRQRYMDATSKPSEDAAKRQAVADLCHMLLSANEFIYVD